MELQDPQQGPRRKGRKDDSLPGAWKQVQGAIWLIGLAVIAWKGWWWPGMLVLVAVSGLFQAGVQAYLARTEQEREVVVHATELDEARAAWLPSTCPSCGAPINPQSVIWNGSQSAACPYCSASIKPSQAVRE